MRTRVSTISGRDLPAHLSRFAALVSMARHIGYWLLVGFLWVSAAACSVDSLAETTSTAAILPAASQTQAQPPTFTATAVVATAAQLRTSEPARSPSSTPDPSPTPAPTLPYAILRGQVLADAACNYGPGSPYLFKYLLIEGSNLEIIGRSQTGDWILVRAIGGNNPCWVKAANMQAAGDILSLGLAYMPLPASPYYGPLQGVSAARTGNLVTITWQALALNPGDDSGQYPYLIEANLCENGRLSLKPVGTYQTQITLRDEPGCVGSSYAHIAAAEKHGYTYWVEIPWPQVGAGTTPDPLP